MSRLIIFLLSTNFIQCQFQFNDINTFVPFEPKPGQRCAGRNYPGGRRCCTPQQPCDEGEGDCDGPDDGGQHDGHAGCKGNLVCGSNNCKKFGRYYHEKDDCCEKPSETQSESTTAFYPDTPLEPPPGQRCSGRNYLGGRRCCTPQQPCDEGEGDCDGPGDGGQHDGHAGCKGDLVCGTNNCRKFGAYFHEKDDCCEKRFEDLIKPPTSKTCKGRNFSPRRCCTPQNPCPEGEGDCEIDNDCSGNLVCGNNNCKQFGTFFHEKDDCCVKPKVTSAEPFQRCKGRNFFPKPCCTPQNPCPEGEGDCEIDNDCSGELVCGNNNCKQFGSFYHEKDDCCVKPTASVTPRIPQITTSVPLEPRPGQKCAGRNYQVRRCCTPDNPCDEGEGDCDGPGDGGQHDGHAGCKGDLVCGTNNCLKFGLYYHPKDDCCEKPSAVTETEPPKPPLGVWLEPPQGEKCSGRNYQGRRCCTPESPCDVGQGDCDGPADGGQHDGNRGCRPGLVCGSNNCLKFGAYFHPKDDCCEFPDGSGGWGQWSEFGACSKSCGVGRWSRHRYCKGPGCPHTTQSQERFCNTQPC